MQTEAYVERENAKKCRETNAYVMGMERANLRLCRKVGGIEEIKRLVEERRWAKESFSRDVRGNRPMVKGLREGVWLL